VTAFLLALASTAFAQPPTGDVEIGKREIVHSTILNEDRPILVSLPPPPAPGAPRGSVSTPSCT
jgi:hypothetical protein